MAKKTIAQSKQLQHSSTNLDAKESVNEQSTKVESKTDVVTVSKDTVQAAELLAQNLSPWFDIKGKEAVEGVVKFAVLQVANGGLIVVTGQGDNE